MRGQRVASCPSVRILTPRGFPGRLRRAVGTQVHYRRRSMAYPRVTPEDIAFLKQAIGDRHVSAGESNLDLHSRDESYLEPHRPDVVVWPQKTGDVVAAVTLAARKGYAVTPW